MAAGGINSPLHRGAKFEFTDGHGGAYRAKRCRDNRCIVNREIRAPRAPRVTAWRKYFRQNISRLPRRILLANLSRTGDKFYGTVGPEAFKRDAGSRSVVPRSGKYAYPIILSARPGSLAVPFRPAASLRLPSHASCVFLCTFPFFSSKSHLRSLSLSFLPRDRRYLSERPEC